MRDYTKMIFIPTWAHPRVTVGAAVDQLLERGETPRAAELCLLVDELQRDAMVRNRLTLPQVLATYQFEVSFFNEDGREQVLLILEKPLSDHADIQCPGYLLP